MTRVLVVIENGVVSEIYSDSPVKAYVVDHDDDAEDPVLFGEHHVHELADFEAEIIKLAERVA